MKYIKDAAQTLSQTQTRKKRNQQTIIEKCENLIDKVCEF